jgi:aminoglycoside 6'-N-acetyltransferase
LIAEREDEAGFVIEHAGRVVGYIQAAQEPDAEFRHASIDLFLSSVAQGQGLGPEAIRTLAGDLIGRGGHHRITIDPLVANTRAISAYVKVGFRPVGRLRQYQRMPDGTWADGLLMEMLATELLSDPTGGTR